MPEKFQIYNPVYQEGQDVLDQTHRESQVRYYDRELAEGFISKNVADPDVQAFFKEFMSPEGSVEGTVVIIDSTNGRKYVCNPGEEIGDEGGVIGHRGLREPTLIIEDLDSFCEVMKDLQQTLDRKHDINPWANEQNSIYIWRSATPYDFEHPVEYIKSRIAIINDETFERLEEWTPLSELPEIGEVLHVRHAVKGSAFESPHDLIFASYPEGSEYRDEHALPSVRYGLIDDRTAIIYAIQMPYVHEISEPNLLRMKETCEFETLRINNAVKSLYYVSADDFVSFFGEPPRGLMDIEDPVDFVPAFLAHVGAVSTEEGFPDIRTWLKSKITDKGFFEPGGISKQKDVDRTILLGALVSYAEQESGFPYETLDLIKGLNRIKAELAEYEERRGRLARFNSSLSGGVPSDLRSAPPAAVVSLSASLAMFSSEGITEVLIPTYLPLMQHANPEKDTRILMQNITLARRVSHEINGVEITQEPDEDYYLHLSLADTLSSNRPIINNVIKGARESRF